MTTRTKILSGTAVLVAAVVGIVAWLTLQPASAETTGSCDNAFYELSADTDDGALEVDFELTSNAPEERWTVLVEHNGTVVHEAERVTDGDAEIDVDLLQRPTGDDVFTVTATPDGGQSCVAEISPR